MKSKKEQILELIKQKSRNDFRAKEDSWMFLSDYRAYSRRRPEKLESFLDEELAKWQSKEKDVMPSIDEEESLEQFCEKILK